jgi:alpha-amylase
MNSEKQYLNLYFQVHQPRRLKRFQFFDVGSDADYFDDDLNKEILCRIAKECYLPANELLLQMIRRFPQIRVTFSISGAALEQFELYAPAVLRSFRQLSKTGAVEFLAETYYHSLSYFINHEEFVEQVRMHQRKMNELLGVDPVIFRNTELIYSDGIGATIHDLGFKGVFIDGIARVLKGVTSNALYQHPYNDLVLFPRNFQLSDDIAFRYSDQSWCEWPLTGKKIAKWIANIPADEGFVSLGMDYETFGEHKKAETGIFAFLKEFITEVIGMGKFSFVNPSEAVSLIPADHIISSERVISWADEARDLSAWLGNSMQKDAFDSLYKFHDSILDSHNIDLITTYRHLQTSDHFYYMSTKEDNDGVVHQYFSPFSSPYEAFMNFMNIISDLELRVKRGVQRDAMSGIKSTTQSKELAMR